MRVSSLVEAIVASMRRTGYPFPVPRDLAYNWAWGTGLPRSGRVYLFTGAMYQLAPYIEAAVEALRRYGAAAVKASRLPLVQRLLRPRRELLEWSRRVLLSAARLAASSIEGLAYLYEDDAYTGIILYDLGLDEEFAAHAEKICRRLRARGATRLIVLDPHTLYALRELYPRYVDGCSVEASSYLEHLAPSRLGAGAAGAVALHEPCLYARRLGLVEAPRRLLGSAGLEVRLPPRSGRMTSCCGGPVEALAPSLAAAVARDRAEELLSTGAETVVTMCPICFINLSRAARELGRGRVVDIAEVLSPAG